MTEQSHSWAYIQKKTFLIKDTCTLMFIAELFTIAKIWKQPKRPTTDDWIRKMCYIYTMEYYSVIKRNKIMPFAATWMQLEILILNEVSQKESQIPYHLFVESKIWHRCAYLQNRNRLTDIENTVVVAKREGVG